MVEQGPAAAAAISADIVLLHGFLGAGRNLGGLRRALSGRLPGVRVAAPDLPGHGDAPPLAAGADLSAVAEVLSLAARAGGTPAPRLWVGHSLGGRVLLAMAAAGAHEALVPPAQVVLLDITASPLGALEGAMRAVFDALFAAPAVAPSRESMRDYFVARGVSPALADWAATNLRREGEAFGWRIDRQALAAFHRRDVAASLWEGVARLGRRCRVVVGGRSPFVSSADRERFVALGAEVVIAEDADHFVHIEAAAPTLAACLAAWSAAA